MVGRPTTLCAHVRILRWMLSAVVCLAATGAHASTDAGVYAFGGAADLAEPTTSSSEALAPSQVGARSVHLRARVQTERDLDLRGFLPLGGFAAFALVAPLLWRRKRTGGSPAIRCA
jgi:hypothetical protein